ncbi:MAG: maleylpyruvate isomerase family mycothiol-dependent enzyme [Acidimicrobiales bacterium]
MISKVQTDTWEIVAQERRQLVTDLADLAEARFDTDTDLAGWTAKAVLAHIVTPFLIATPRFVGSMIRYRGDLDKVNNKYAAKLSERPVSELLAALGDNADSRWSPPGAGVELPLTEIVVHAQDLRRALGIAHKVPVNVEQIISEYTASRKGSTPVAQADIDRRLAPVG